MKGESRGTWSNLQDPMKLSWKKWHTGRGIKNDDEKPTWRGRVKQFFDGWKTCAEVPMKEEVGQASKPENHSNPAEVLWQKLRKVSYEIAGIGGERGCVEFAFCGHPRRMKRFKLGWGAVSTLVQVHILVPYVMDLSLPESTGVLTGWPCNPFIHSFVHSLIHPVTDQSLLYIRQAQNHIWPSSPY